MGSRRENRICLEGAGVSKHHAVLRVASERVTVEDLASKNGTFVNGQRIRHGSLVEGDRLELAAVALRLERTPASDAELAIQLEPASGRGGDSALQETPWVENELASPSSSTDDRPLVFPKAWLPGDSPAMRHFLSQVHLLVDSVLPVLILGETGVGKEGVALTLHRSSSRAQGPFVAINCAAIPEALLEAELFGIGSGVATGVRGRQGRFAEADGGTLFLDEIGGAPRGAELPCGLRGPPGSVTAGPRS